jgi:carboxyl-terminal processing protease
VSRYDDPRWYEEQQTGQQSPTSAYDDFDQNPSYIHNHGPGQQRVLSTNSYDKNERFRHVLGQILLTVALVVIAFCGGWFCHQYFGAVAFNTSDQSRAYSQVIQQAWTTVDQNYVDRKNVNYKNMSYAAIKAMVDTLQDKGHSRFMTPQEVQAENQHLSGKFTGIGIYIHEDKNTKQLIVTAPISGSPAEKAGMKHGDVITAVNGKSTTGLTSDAISNLIEGNAGTKVTVRIQRPGVAQPIDFHMIRAEINVPNVIIHYIPESHIAHIQITQFADGVSSQLKDALNQAKSKGARKIILDLRDNPGGYLNEAIDTASFFVKSGNVLQEQDSSGKRTPMTVNGNTINTTDTIVVLVNENSASAAEIVTGALKDNGRAIVIGQRTFGTGTVLQPFTLSDGSAILLGTQEWLTPKGQFIRDKGIEPNIKVALKANQVPLQAVDENAGNMTQQQILNSGDAQLSAAIKYLQTH